MKINLATFFTLFKNEYKSPKYRFTGKTSVTYQGGKKPQTTTKYGLRKRKTSLPAEWSQSNLSFVPKQLKNRRGGYIGAKMYPLHMGVREHVGNKF